MAKPRQCQTWIDDDPADVCGNGVVVIARTTCANGKHLESSPLCLICLCKMVNQELDCTVCHLSGDPDSTQHITSVATL